MHVNVTSTFARSSDRHFTCWVLKKPLGLSNKITFCEKLYHILYLTPFLIEQIHAANMMRRSYNDSISNFWKKIMVGTWNCHVLLFFDWFYYISIITSTECDYLNDRQSIIISWQRQIQSHFPYSQNSLFKSNYS